MFKNPLKYQEGGSVQDAMKQLVAWLVQNTGLDEGQISQRLNQILSDDTAKQELATNLQNMQNGDREAEERIKNMFIPKNAKLGGKIQDFICKHAKGGKAGCGCKKAEGGEIETRKKLKPIGMPMQHEGTVYTDRYPASGEQITMGDTGDPMRIAAYDSYNHFGQGISVPTPAYRAMTRGLIDGSGWGHTGKVLTPSEVSKWLNFNKAVDASNRIQNPQQKSLEMENGGMVQKNELGSDGIGKYSASGRKLKTSEVPNMPVDFDPVNVTTETLPTGARRMIFNAVDSNGQAVADTVININGVRYRSPHVTKTWNKNNNSSLTPSESAWYDANYYFDDAKDDNILNALEYDNGGKVAMSQGGGSDSNWFTRMYNRFIGRRVPDTVEATDRRLKTWTDANGVQHIVEDANVNGNSTVTTIDINGADTLGKEKITTGDGRYRILNLQPGTPEWRAAMSRNVQEQECGGRIAKKQWGGKATGKERETIANKNPYWEDITINPEFGTTYKLVVPDDFGNVIDEKYFRHYSPNGTNRIKRTSILSENPSIRWSKTYAPGMRDYPWQDYYFNYMKSNVPQRLSNAQRLIPPMYQKDGGKVEKAQGGVEFPSDTTKVTYGSYRVFPKLMNFLGIDSTPFDYEYVSWNNRDGSSPYLQMPLRRANWFNYHDGKHIGLPNSYETELQRPYKHSWNGFLFTPAGKIHRPVDKNTYNKVDSLIQANRQNNNSNDRFKSGGKVEKAQSGTRSLYQQITADGPETYTDGYGTVREMNESPIITGLRKAYHWINMDRTLSDNAYSQKHGYSKPLTGMPPAVYISPVAQEINLAKYIGFRTPTQMSAEKNAAYSIKAAVEKQKAIDAATKAGKIYIEPKIPSDWDIDLSMFKSNYNVPDLNNIIKFGWPEFIGRNVLLPASGVVGSAAAGSYVATKKDKNKKSENK